MEGLSKIVSESKKCRSIAFSHLGIDQLIKHKFRQMPLKKQESSDGEAFGDFHVIGWEDVLRNKVCYSKQ